MTPASGTRHWFCRRVNMRKNGFPVSLRRNTAGSWRWSLPGFLSGQFIDMPGSYPDHKKIFHSQPFLAPPIQAPLTFHNAPLHEGRRPRSESLRVLERIVLVTCCGGRKKDIHSSRQTEETEKYVLLRADVLLPDVSLFWPESLFRFGAANCITTFARSVRFLTLRQVGRPETGHV